MQEIFNIIIEITSVNEVNGNGATVKMISFKGRCQGRYFNGEIMDGGVDTQFISEKEGGNVSARYMMKGVDNKLNPCKVFIENEGDINSQGDMKTIPRIVTDSAELSWLQDKNLYGSVAVENDNRLHVRIYV